MNTSKLAHFVFSSAFVFAASALGAGCVVDSEDAPLEEEELAEASQAIGMVDDASVFNLAQIGGTGGNAYAATLCPAGYVATGLTFATSDWVNNMAMSCRELRADGSFGALGVTVSRGGPGGTGSWESCPANQVLVGQMIGTNGQYVGKVGGKCASLSRVLASAGGSDGDLGPFGSQGAVLTNACPAGYAVVGFQGRSASSIDRVGFVCKRILMPSLPLPVSSTVSGLGITIKSASIDGNGNVLNHVAPGQALSVNVGYTITQSSGCPGCIDQILVGLAPSSPAGCVYNGIPSTSGTSGSGTVTITAPTTPGLYYISNHYAQDKSCNLGWWTMDDSSRTIGIINVF